MKKNPKKTQITKTVMVDLPSYSESNKKSSTVKPGNYLKFDYESRPSNSQDQQPDGRQRHR